MSWVYLLAQQGQHLGATIDQRDVISAQRRWAKSAILFWPMRNTGRAFAQTIESHTLRLWREIWAGSSLRFLRNCTGLRGLSLLDWKVQRLDPVESLSSIEYLKINTPQVKRPARVDLLHQLETLSVEFSRAVKGVRSAKSLRKLFLGCVSPSFAGEIEELQYLRELEIADLRAADPTLHLPSIQRLVLRCGKKVRDLSEGSHWECSHTA